MALLAQMFVAGVAAVAVMANTAVAQPPPFQFTGFQKTSFGSTQIKVNSGNGKIEVLQYRADDSTEWKWLKDNPRKSMANLPDDPTAGTEADPCLDTIVDPDGNALWDSIYSGLRYPPSAVTQDDIILFGKPDPSTGTLKVKETQDLPKPAYNVDMFRMDFAEASAVYGLAAPGLSSGGIAVTKYGFSSVQWNSDPLVAPVTGTQIFSAVDTASDFTIASIVLEFKGGILVSVNDVQAVSPKTMNMKIDNIINESAYALDQAIFADLPQNDVLVGSSAIDTIDPPSNLIDLNAATPELLWAQMEPWCGSPANIVAWLSWAVYADGDTYNKLTSSSGTICAGTPAEMQCNQVQKFVGTTHTLICTKFHLGSNHEEYAAYTRALAKYNDLVYKYRNCPNKMKMKKPKEVVSNSWTEAFISFRGTVTMSEWWSNIAGSLTKTHSSITGMKAHSGFFDQYEQNRDILTMDDKLRDYNGQLYPVVNFYGHSRGGAVAEIAAAQWKAMHPDVIVTLRTVGAPAAVETINSALYKDIPHVAYTNKRRRCYWFNGMDWVVKSAFGYNHNPNRFDAKVTKWCEFEWDWFDSGCHCSDTQRDVDVYMEYLAMPAFANLVMGGPLAIPVFLVVAGSLIADMAVLHTDYMYQSAVSRPNSW